MAQVFELPQDDRVELNNRMRDLAFELNMQATLLAHLDPAEAMMLTGKARGLMMACDMVMEDRNA